MAIKFNTLYNHTKLEGFKSDKPSKTQQSFGFETDINNIVKGMIAPSYNQKTPLFNQVVAPDAYENALNVIADANSRFEELPSHIRAEFGNDPKKLLAFIDNPDNYEKAVKLGLIEKKITAEPPVGTGTISTPVNPVEPPVGTGTISTPVNPVETPVTEVSSQ